MKKIRYKSTIIIIKIKKKTKYNCLIMKAKGKVRLCSMSRSVIFSDDLKWLSDWAIIISLFRSFQSLAPL